MGSDQIKREYSWLTVFLLALILVQPVSAGNGAYGIEVTDDYVHVDGAKCSCVHSDGYYYHENITFLNRCPNCGGKLYYEEMDYWVEGMWVCKYCDMDFCLVHGRSHDNLGYYLYIYSDYPPMSYENHTIELKKA